MFSNKCCTTFLLLIISTNIYSAHTSNTVRGALEQLYIKFTTASVNKRIECNNINTEKNVKERIVITCQQSLCSVPERYIGPSNCTYLIQDPNIIDDSNKLNFTLGPAGIDTVFQFSLDPVVHPTKEIVARLQVLEEQNANIIAGYIFYLLLSDTRGNFGYSSLTVFVEEAKN